MNLLHWQEAKSFLQLLGLKMDLNDVDAAEVWRKILLEHRNDGLRAARKLWMAYEREDPIKGIRAYATRIEDFVRAGSMQLKQDEIDALYADEMRAYHQARNKIPSGIRGPPVVDGAQLYESPMLAAEQDALKSMKRLTIEKIIEEREKDPTSTRPEHPRSYKGSQ